MASPFPGMDPYLERHWRDVHASLVIYARDQLDGRLPRDLRARVEERVFLESTSGVERETYPDVRIVERARAAPPAPKVHGGIITAEPLIVVAEEPVPDVYSDCRGRGR